MLQVRENEISLCNSSDGPEYLRTLEGTLLTGASLKPMQPMRLHWAPRLGGPRAMVFGQVVCVCQTLLAHENCRKPYESHCQQIIIV